MSNSVEKPGLTSRIKGAYRMLVSGSPDTMATGFDSGSRMVQRIKNWVPPTNEINAAITSDGQLMRNRSRKLIVENPWASAALDLFVSNAVSTGPIPRPFHPDANKRQQMIYLFDRWSRVCVSNSSMDFYALCALAVRAQRSDGDSFTRIRYRRTEDGLPVGMQLQPLEADFCPLNKHELLPTTGHRIEAGIEFDGIGRRSAYWMHKAHPAGSNPGARDLELFRVPADEIVHMFEVKRPGQERGYPWLTPSIIALYDLKQLMDASLMRLKLANLLSIWIKKGPNSNGILGETPVAGVQGTVPTPAAGTTQGRYETSFAPGSVNYCEENEEPHFLIPPDQGNNFQAFVNFYLRSIARALGLTYEQLSGDLTGVNFASSRAGILEMRRLMEMWQYHVMIHQFCRPIWDKWIREALLEGRLWRGAESEFAANPAYFAADWAPPAWPWVDPVKDLQAARDRIRAGLGSRRKELARLGEDIEQIDQENHDDNERSDDLGLMYDSDGRVALGAGRKPAEEEEEEEDPANQPAKGGG
jgi:lambda family phage portal protein